MAWHFLLEQPAGLSRAQEGQAVVYRCYLSCVLEGWILFVQGC